MEQKKTLHKLRTVIFALATVAFSYNAELFSFAAENEGAESESSIVRPENPNPITLIDAKKPRSGQCYVLTITTITNKSGESLVVYPTFDTKGQELSEAQEQKVDKLARTFSADETFKNLQPTKQWEIDLFKTSSKNPGLNIFVGETKYFLGTEDLQKLCKSLASKVDLIVDGSGMISFKKH